VSLKWKLQRLSAMGGREIGYRLGKALQTRSESLGFGLAKWAKPVGSEAKAWLDELPRGLDPSVYCAAADHILDGRFNIFALDGACIGFPPRWNRDPKTGAEAPLSFGKLVDYRDERIVGDIKYLWEPNRHLELVTLAQAWHLTGEVRYLHGCQSLLDSWFEQCPYPLGLNWTSSLEHAVRMVNWSVAWRLLGAERSVLFEGDAGAAFKSRWLNSIHQHCHFICGYLSRYSSANNHLIGELTGLFIGATTWPLWKSSQRWRDMAQRELEREALKQTFGDGVNREQATWYHHSVTDMMLLAGLFARANSRDFGREYWRRVEAMMEFIVSITDAGGNVPSFGDSDDGVMVRLSPSRELHVFRSLLATGAVLFGRADFKAKAGVFDDKSRWLLGDGAAQAFASLRGDPKNPPARRAFPDGGYYLLGDRFETHEEIRIVADAGPLGYLSIAAHGHADALSFTVSAGGRELLIDPGTYSYHTQRRWREYFRGTSAHNTLRLDGESQSLSGGNFLWIRHGNGRAVSFDTTPDQDRLVGEHDGYRRLADPVDTRRELLYDRRNRTLTVIDSLVCQGRHRVELFWHFSDDCNMALSSDDVIGRNANASIKLHWPSGFAARIVRGSEDMPAGWLSRGYDRRVPCSTVIVAGEVSGNWQGLSTIEISVDAPQ
jgi:hypothetical protein